MQLYDGSKIYFQQAHAIVNKHTNKQTNEVLCEKLFVLELAKKFPQFYNTQNFITVFTTYHHLSTS